MFEKRKTAKTLSSAWAIYEEEMAKRSNDDYEANEEQLQKLVDAYDFLCKLAEDEGGYVEPLEIVPKKINGGITAYFVALCLDGEQILQFCNSLSIACALSLDATTNGEVCISFTVPNVFRRKRG